MTVTVPSGFNTDATISLGTGDVLQLASQISRLLTLARDTNDLIVISGDSVTTPPAAPNLPSPTVNELLLQNSTISGSVDSGYQVIIDIDANLDTLSVTDQELITGAAGGSWNLFGNSTLAATGGNNTVTGTGSYTMSFGPGQNIVFANGDGSIDFDPSGTAVVVSNGNNAINDHGSSGNLFVASSGSTTVNASGNGNGILGDGDDVVATLSGSNDVVSTGNSNASISAGGSGHAILGGSGSAAGSLNVTLGGSSDSVGTFDANATINASGSNNLIFAGSTGASVNVSISGDNNSVVGGTGTMTITASSGVAVFGGSGPLSFVGGATASTILGGANASDMIEVGTGGVGYSEGANATATIVGAVPVPGQATVLGGSNSELFFNETVAGGTGDGLSFEATSGNETLNAALSNTYNQLSGGSDANGSVTLIGGSGGNSFFVGAGTNSLVGGNGTDTFAFFKSVVTAGQNDTISGFDINNDTVDILGYDTTASAESLLRQATVSGGVTTLKLSDNTTITFTNIADPTNLAGRIFYG